VRKLTALLLLLSLLLAGCSVEYVPPTAPVPEEDGLFVHFIDVGQADCALIEYGDFHMLIDGGNREDGRMVVSYLLEQGIETLDIVVATHPHEDHIGGLPAVLAVFPVTRAVYAPTDTYNSSFFDDLMNYVDQQRLQITKPVPGDTVVIDEDLSFTLLGPVKSYEEVNDTSIVLRLDHGENSFLFTGDMELTAENDMLDNGADVDVDVLKVGHHGSYTSTGYRFLYEAMPQYAVISVGAGNDYGHPHKEPLARLRDAGCTIFRTDHLGTVVAASDGLELTFFWENTKAEPAYAQKAAPRVFIGNRNSLVFHAPDCDSLPSEKNRIEFSTYEEALEAGCIPCGGCLGGG